MSSDLQLGLPSEATVGFDKFTHHRAGISCWIAECGHSPTRLGQAGGCQGACPPGPIKGGIGPIRLEFGLKGVELDDETAETVCEHIVQIAGYPGSFLEGGGPASLLGCRQPVFKSGVLGGV